MIAIRDQENEASHKLGENTCKRCMYLVEDCSPKYATLEDSLAVFYNIKYTLSIQSDNHARWHLPKAVGNLRPQKPCIQMFITALFVIAKMQKQQRCPLVDE